jgi:hypothetical protein
VVTTQTYLRLVFQGGGYVSITVQPGAETTLVLETYVWDVAVRRFLIQLSRRRRRCPL